MKKADKVVKFVIVFLLEFSTYGFIGAAVEAYKNRSDGNVGGEILIIPLIIVLIALGYQIKANQK